MTVFEPSRSLQAFRRVNTIVPRGRRAVAFIAAHANGQLDFDTLIASIRLLYSVTAVTVADYYAARIARQTEIASARGLPVPNPALECTIRVAAEQGLQREIAVPIREGLTLRGRVDRHGCLFTAERFSRSEVEPLVELLAAAGLGVEVDEAESIVCATIREHP
jgi:hypothetical protein